MTLALYAAGALALTALVVLLWLPAPHSPARVRHAVEIRRAPDAVFAFVTTPGNWAKWHPATLSVDGSTDHPLEVGERLTEHYRISGVRYRVAWTVVERDAPRRWRIEGKGLLRDEAWIAYTLVATPAGTRFERELTYRMPNLLAAWLAAGFVHESTEQVSALALARLKAVLEGERSP